MFQIKESFNNNKSLVDVINEYMNFLEKEGK